MVDGRYQKYPSCRTCPVPGAAAEDNWVWSRQGAVAMHKPETWGFLQFSASKVNSTQPAPLDEWPARACAAELYYAQKAFAAAEGGGLYAASVKELLAHTARPGALDGRCLGMGEAKVVLGEGGKSYRATLVGAGELEHRLEASVTQDRYRAVRRLTGEEAAAVA